MTKKNIALVALATSLVVLPLARFAASPSFEAARAVDLLLVFASGMTAGGLAASVIGRKRLVR